MNKKEFVFLLIVTFVVVIIWIAYDIFFKTKASIEIDPKLQTILEPIKPTFDQEAIDLILKNSSNL